MIQAMRNPVAKYSLLTALYFVALGGMMHKTMRGIEKVQPIYQEMKDWKEFISQSLTEGISNALDVIRPRLPSLEDRVKQNTELLIKNPANKIAFEKAASRATQFSDYLEEASKATGLEKNLITAVMLTESKANLRAYSKTGAGGPMQVMPRTGKYLGLKINEFTDERFSPESTSAGGKYLKELINRYQNLTLALAAYNMGPTALDNAIKKHGKEWSQIEPYISEETRNYVVKVLSRKNALDDANGYGISIEQKPLFSEKVNRSGVHHAKKGETLYKISREYGVPVNRLKEMNPTIKDYSRIGKGQRIFIPRG